MRKLGALLLAVPLVVAVYAASLVRRNASGRLLGAVPAMAIVALVAIASLHPAPSAAAPASGKPAPVSASLLDTVRTGHSLTAPFVVRFDAPMDAASVAAALRIQPDAAVSLSWDVQGTSLRVAPVGSWAPDTLYSITVDGNARSAAGAVLVSPVRALILTAAAGKGSVEATQSAGTQVRIDTAFSIHLDRSVPVDEVQSAIHTDPAAPGIVTAGDAPGDYVYTPVLPLQPGTTYRVWLEGLVDADGVPFDAIPELTVATTKAPAVVRFRPLNGAGSVEPTATISVRFTERMDRATTAAAFHVQAAGKPVTGKTSWAEQDTVLVFVPSAALPYGATVTASVDVSATSRDGVALAGASTGTFTVKAKPKPAPKPAATQPITRSGGSGAVSGTWKAVETYYLKLMNCTRTGGWVTSTGACSSPGGRDVAPLWISSAISDKVSRPYAKLLVTQNICSHFVGGTPGDRLRRAGFTSYKWAENLGCLGGEPYWSVLHTHLYFQSEKSYNGGHYVNMMNPLYDRVGIGVWVYSGRVRLVIDFYHP